MFSGNPIDFDDARLTNDGFWPDLSVKDFQSQRTIPADIDAATIRQALLTAAGEINDDLVNVADRYQDEGYASAGEVPGIEIDGENLLCARYCKAVYARAKADLMGEFATIGRRESHPGQESDETRSSLIAESTLAVRRIKGLRRITVAMI
ncbi:MULTISPECIES: head completion/stabilization protein [Klebsiella pneumoniae complex]|uniref:head completion/stabilization protein n=1 Tax=Klebsiella pneumoniae complex TaxID=3390273 RepID=UPI001C2BB9AB|nr:head completion/stabilization protein [Klebsiella quasipneumoniae]EKX8521859.1 head completion/stabilization protein [Klebsiella pneumoniae]MBV0364533.1 head completion/stabilization protein [Klebsiella quasipneumoniae]MDT9767241.1 head completion/stabilization protein [Klebsiella quasipneumoniae]MDV0812426.1 head completion/stabilization protein [Klebsiella quasipneumoniae subsp. quasipneumoniae]MDW3817976.1 head completion/stabilization protein [Klebsiella quasipneumoniae]